MSTPDLNVHLGLIVIHIIVRTSLLMLLLYHSHQTNPHPPPLLRPRYDIFSWAVHIDRPYGALKVFHTGGSVVGVGVAIVVLTYNSLNYLEQ